MDESKERAVDGEKKTRRGEREVWLLCLPSASFTIYAQVFNLFLGCANATGYSTTRELDAVLPSYQLTTVRIYAYNYYIHFVLVVAWHRQTTIRVSESKVHETLQSR